MARSNTIYFDYAAATPVSDSASKAMQPYLTDFFYNPSAIYLAAKAVRGDIEQFRSLCARVLGVRSSEIIFTSGATEANNFAIHGLIGPSDELIVSASEHDSVIKPAAEHGAALAPVDKHGRLDLAKLEAIITDKTKLISVMMVNNETGTVQPVKDVVALAERCRKDRQKRGIEQPLLVHTDASQATNCFDIQTPRLGVDLMSLNGGKMYGPKASGCLYVRAGIELRPIISGGGQEHGMRSGTESAAQIAGFTTALVEAQRGAKQENARLQDLYRQLTNGIEALSAQAEISGHHKWHSPHIIHVRFPGVDNERLVMELDEMGVQAAAGSACKASSDAPSSVLLAMGFSAEQASETVRFSMGRHTTTADIDGVLQVLQKCLLQEKH